MSNLVSKEIAKKLDQLGFNKWTLNLFEKGTDKEFNAFDKRILYLPCENYYKRPTISEALDYMREEIGIICYIDYCNFQNIDDNRYYMDEWVGVIVFDRVENYSITEYCNSHKEAELALLEAVIKYVEENENRN